MKTTIAELERDLDTNLHPCQPEFHLAIFYSDYDTGCEAMEVYQHLIEHFGDELLMRASYWRLGVLRHPELREGLRLIMNKTDLILIALPANTGLPIEARQTIQKALETAKPKTRSLVALIGSADGDHETNSSAGLSLAQMAQKYSLNFFAGEFRTETTTRGNSHATVSAAVRSHLHNYDPPAESGLND